MQVNINHLEIPKASAYAAKALEIITGENPDVVQLEQAIMHDPLLASSLLRYANSPLYRRATEITNVPTAIKLLGLKSVRSAIVTAAIRSMLPADSVVGQTILTHMIDIAGLCKIICRQCCVEASDDLEFLGLVHDVGMLTLAANYENVYSKLVREAQAQQMDIIDLERKEFGISHNVVTARTAESFRLPKWHCELLMNFHSHQPITAITNDSDRDTCILGLAHHLRRELGETNSGINETIAETKDDLISLLYLDDSKLEKILEHAQSVLAMNSSQ